MQEAFGFDIDAERAFWGLEARACTDPVLAKRWALFAAIYSLKVNMPRAARDEAIEHVWDRRGQFPNLVTREEVEQAFDAVWGRLDELARQSRLECEEAASVGA